MFEGSSVVACEGVEVKIDSCKLGYLMNEIYFSEFEYRCLCDNIVRGKDPRKRIFLLIRLRSSHWHGR